jgi:hypothetical protein
VAKSRTKTILTKSLAMLALLALLAGCDITAKTASPDPVSVGEPLTFTIEVDFEPGEQGAIVVDELPESVQFVSAQVDPLGECFPVDDNTVLCAVENPNIQEGGTATITIVVTPTECGTFTNTAFIPFETPTLEQQAALDQLSTEQLAAEQLSLEQLPLEELVTAQQVFDEESVTFTVVGCEEPQPQPQPQSQPQSAPGLEITQEGEQESESGEVDQTFDIS